MFNKPELIIENGFKQVEKSLHRKLRNELMLELGITSRNGWRKRYKGVVVPTITEYLKIVEVLKRYGVEAIEVCNII